MKLNTADNVIERSGDLQDEQKFTIALTAKAIEVLSSQIYKDAHLAIVRELGTNAADSHIDAGKRNVPFDVMLPNGMTPELVIRDYGTGMAYEKVMTMYRTYFGSDKTNSDEVTGCLGLGSKSPLAYTDQFQVTSWFGGEKSVYIIYKNEKGLPAINRIFNEKSDEPTGVEVRISVKKFDFPVFKEKALETYCWFTPRPNVIGVSDDEWPNDEIAFGTDTWKLRKNAQLKMTVVMGNVAYHVERGDLNPITSKMDRAERTLCDCGPILHVGIGDVDIAASRETLKFDGQKTYATIKRLLTKMSKELVEKFQAEIDACPSHWEARKLFKKLKHTQPLGLVLPDKVTWKGLELDTKINLTKIDGHSVKEIYATARKFYMSRQRRTYQWCVSQSQVNSIDCEEHAALFVVEGKNHISRVSHFVRTSLKTNSATGHSEYATAYVLTKAEKPGPTNLADGTVKESDVEAWELDDFLKENFLEDAVQKTSTLPDPPRNTPGFRTKASDILVALSDPKRSSHWGANDIEFEKGGVYVEVRGNHWFAGHMVDRKASELFALHPIIKAQEITGVRQRSLSDFEEADNWVRLDEYIVKKYKDNVEARNAAANFALWQRVNSSYELDHVHDLKSMNPTHKDGLFVTIVNELHKLEKASKNELAREYSLAQPFLVSNSAAKAINTDKEFAEFKRMFVAFEQRYPMLLIINSWHANKNLILNYVGLIDGIKIHKKKRKAKRKQLQEA